MTQYEFLKEFHHTHIYPWHLGSKMSFVHCSFYYVLFRGVQGPKIQVTAFAKDWGKSEHWIKYAT